MRPLLVFPLLCMALLRGFGEEALYRSNDFGMALAPIPSSTRGDSDWVLGIEGKGNGELRRLYNNGKEVRRWETAWNEGRTERVERESADGLPSARRVYDAAGFLLKEEEYSGGTVSRSSLYSYAAGRLARKRVLDGEDRELFVETFLYAATGGLREVRRIDASGGTGYSAAVAGPTGVSEDRAARGGWLSIDRYDLRGNLSNRERRVDGVVVSVEDFEYAPDSNVLRSSKERHLGKEEATDRTYDESGRLAFETTSVKGQEAESIAYERDGQGRVTGKRRRSATGMEVWKYARDDKGEVTREEYTRRGMLAKVTTYGKDKLRTEELYADGELFLKVYYDGDTRLREEVFAGGAAQRERTFP